MSRAQVDPARPLVETALPAVPRSRHHVGGFYVLCATVGLERFSFFLLSAVLVLYLNEQLGVAAARAIEIYGYLVSGSYLTPLVGGRLGDGRVGHRRTTLCGVALQAIGYLLLFSPRLFVVYGALALIALGSGLFKAGTQVLLGSLYPAFDGRRERSFSGFYLVINVGALGAPLIGGWTQKQAGWPWCFTLASLGALLSFGVFALGQRLVSGFVPKAAPRVTRPPLASRQRAHRQLALVLLAGFVFAVNFVQSHSSLLLWARDRTARSLGSFELPVAWFAAAPAALVLLVTPLLSAVFAALRRSHREPSTLRKIGLGLAVSGLAFVPLWIAALRSPRGPRMSPLWVLGCMTMLALGELLVPALAPAELTRTAPPGQAGSHLSYWFVAVAAGHAIGGWVHF